MVEGFGHREVVRCNESISKHKEVRTAQAQSQLFHREVHAKHEEIIRKSRNYVIILQLLNEFRYRQLRRSGFHIRHIAKVVGIGIPTCSLRGHMDLVGESRECDYTSTGLRTMLWTTEHRQQCGPGFSSSQQLRRFSNDSESISSISTPKPGGKLSTWPWFTQITLPTQ